MDDRRANAVKHADPFAATDALLSSGVQGDSLFVINLCAANMPQAIDASSVRAWGIGGLDSYKLYQVSRQEDGRTRYRVRLGFFTSEADAEVVLRSIRGKFATAFTSGLGDEDLKHASGYLKKPLHEIQEIQDIQRTGRYRVPKFAAEDLPRETSATSRQPILRPAPATIVKAASAMLATPKASSAAPSEEIVEFEWLPDQKSAQSKSSGKPVTEANKSAPVSSHANQGAVVKPPHTKSAANGAMKAAHEMSGKDATSRQATMAAVQKAIAKAAVAKQAPKQAQLQTAKPPATATPIVRVNAPQAGAVRSISSQVHTHAAGQTAQIKSPATAASQPADLPRPLVSADALAKLRAAAAKPRNSDTVIPTLDTTQTIRTLTKKEIEDATAPKWFVVQLAISEHPANLDTMPRLDIFEAYRLYSVAVMKDNIIRHALRLGFFSEQVSAEAVMGYVKTFFGEPTIERISDAEQKRFGESFALMEPPAAEAPKSQARVITMEDKRPVKPLAPIPAANNSFGAGTSNSGKSVGKSSAPAIKRSAPLAAKKASGRNVHGKTVSRKELDEARMLGLSETAIRRVEHNPSLLSRLVNKLTK